MKKLKNFKKVAEKYGYELVDHKLELYGVKKISEKNFYQNIRMPNECL